MSAATHKETISSQCKAQLKTEAVSGVVAGAFDCGNFNHYACERRVFSPELDNLTHQFNECLAGGDICVDVEERQFNTAALRSPGEDPVLFLPGGSYNREEVKCHHRYMYDGVAVFEGEGDSLEQALALAMKACESLGGAR